jgi:hypothetical protein
MMDERQKKDNVRECYEFTTVVTAQIRRIGKLDIGAVIYLL